jgi:serine/threonine-protein kinase
MHPGHIGKYRIDGVLGEGAMGIVYRGFDEAVGRAVAIKVVRKETLAASPAWDAVARFRNEARAAGRLSHPNIVTVYDFAEDAHSAHLVCEYVPGGGLDRWLAIHRRADIATALAWTGQLLDALACAHAHGVVHRDVKPANILVVGGRLLKLADFGIAQVDSGDRTQVGLMIGTPSCMAPEQIRGGPIDGRIDVFAAGVLLHELLTGERPFTGAPEDVMQQILQRTVAPPSQKCPDIPAALDEAVLRALAKEPDQRRAEIGGTGVALRQVAAVAGLPAPADHVDPDATRVVARSDRARLAPSSASQPRWAAAAETDWDPAWLARMERGLTSHVGPIAALLVKKASRSARTREELVSQVARSIAAPSERSRFIEQQCAGAPAQHTGARAAASGAATALPPAAATGAPLDDATVADIERRLTRHLGPMAAICIRRARRDARGVDDLCRRVAQNLAEPSTRRAFLAECGADASPGDAWPPDARPQETSLG